MKLIFIPKTKLGKWSVVLIILMPLLFFIGSLPVNTLYDSVTAGRTILEDIAKRPLVALPMLLGMAFGIFAFVLGISSIIKKKERSFLVYVSTLIGFLLILFLLAEILYPH